MPERGPAGSEAAGTTVLSFDYGERRVGIAVGDACLRTAHPLGVAPAAGAARWAAIDLLVAEWQPGRLVVGMPVRDDGPHPLAPRAARFARQLEARYRVPVVCVDERFSSVEAEHRLREIAGARRAARRSREHRLDAHAAQVILEQYLAAPCGR